MPSISLLQQTLVEWTAQAEVPLRPLAVCSDTKVGKKQDEDASPHDLAFPASTDPQKLYARASLGSANEAVTVVFSTYQSIDVVAQAQGLGLPEFDLIVCDEAHRTTGLTQGDDDDSAFVRVHDQGFLRAKKRLYMTATPRIYVQESKTKAAENDVKVYSMDDESTYGPEFHHLGFGEAVQLGRLADYKVLVLAVNEDSVNKTFQQTLQENGELKIEDVAKIVGCWNGLSKRGVQISAKDEASAEVQLAPMRRAVAFAQNIRESRKIAGMFAEVTDQLLLDDEDALRCEAEHVDGTFNVLDRSAKLDWLKADASEDGNVCRILSNARCLSEGVDVPALDAVMFLNPRNSQVDVVQAVGRVMRTFKGKEYGYIILPIAVPADQAPEEALKDNKKYKVVWDVLQALRAHDDRFNAMINKIELNKNRDDKLQIIGVGGSGDDNEDSGNDLARGVQTTLNFPNLEEWRNAIYARIVQKVGDRKYWEDWAKDVQQIAERHTLRITGILDDPTSGVQEAFDRFLEGLRGNLNDSITRSDAVDMLSQHLITKPVFDALFEGYSFAKHNPVSLVMEDMLTRLEGKSLEAETETLEKFYDSVRMKADGISDAEGKQQIIMQLYEKFFKFAFPRAAASLGIVYTPTEIVDFIIRGVDDLLRAEFDASLSDPGVHVLDPFTGTGTFIVRLLQSGLIKPEDLLYKYTNELHANEILLLAYYIAAINIEATFHGIADEVDGREGGGDEYLPFEGIVLADTFQMTEDNDTVDHLIFPQNNERAARQLAQDIRVIIGNPPYSVGQGSQNDGNANVKYKTLDANISSTYVAKSTARSSRSTYDSYYRALRWASDRILGSDAGGVIAFVTNGGFLEANTGDGLRKSLVNDFHSIYVYNLRGNGWAAGEQRKREAGNVFGSGNRTNVSIIFLVKKPGVPVHRHLYYRDIGDFLTREQKLGVLREREFSQVEWMPIEPNNHGDWITHRTEAFASFQAIGSKSGESGVFSNHSLGLATARDAWVFNYSQDQVKANVRRTIEKYDAQLSGFKGIATAKTKDNLALLEGFIDRTPTAISWSRGLKNSLAKLQSIDYAPESLTRSHYRPFMRQSVYFNRQLNDMVYQLPKMFPEPDLENFGFYISGASPLNRFSVLMLDSIPSLDLFGRAGQFFSRYTFTKRGDVEPDLLSGLESSPSTENIHAFEKVDNISDDALANYREDYGAGVTKDDIFYFVYGLLHSTEYRADFEEDLKKLMPRLPKLSDPSDFHAFANAGRELSALHMGYETAPPYGLEELWTGMGPHDGDRFRVKKMTFGKGKDRSRIIYNEHLTLQGIPADAFKYTLGSRSALEWIMERYQVKSDNASGIVNDPNDWSDEVANPRYIVDLVKRIVTVSVETVRIVEGLPRLRIQTV
ncbi:type ISP restriction/modification enzyme [Pseudarthrobacter sp. NPDC058119]|uniref:type ISP restriction/modification enzyme n=1 Tax=Pseudarthrobacter sp. NPDC058119 TaxID=3346348 RepID=UPI0036D994E3